MPCPAEPPVSVFPRSAGARRRRRALVLAAGLSAGVAGLATSPAVSASPPSTAAGSCRVPAEASDLVPDGAQFMISADLQRLAKSALFKDAKGYLNADPQVRRTLEGLDACKLGIDDLDRITVAGTKNDDFVVVLEGDGIGSTALLQCAAKKLAPASPAATFAPALSGCMTTLDVGEGVGMVLDKRHLVFVSERWKGKVQGRLDGRGTSAAKGSLRPALRNAKRNAPVWFAADIDEPLDTGSGRYDIEGVTGGIDLSRGLHLDLAAHLQSAGQAGQLRQELEGYRAMALMMGPSMGIPADVIGQVQLTGAGADLGISVDLTDAQLRQLEAAAKNL